jgi:arsenate reductase-like glutaredoxin family protein
MENTFLYLSTCSTCVRIIKELGLVNSPLLQDVKQHPASKDQLDFLYAAAKNYESLMNKRGRIFAHLKREGTVFTESIYKDLLEKEYSCLKRPILIFNNVAYMGNAKSTVAEMKVVLNG